MKINTIQVTAGRTFNHPHEQYSNLRPEVSRTANGGSLERVVSRTDSELLTELQNLPYALEIVYKRGTPKADSAPSLREQINHFLEQEKSAAANDKLRRGARKPNDMENTLTSEQQRPAPLPPARGSAASLDHQEMFLECLRDGYTLLMRGDVMHQGDESLRLHDRQWLPLPGGWDGHPWESKHWPPVRRKQQNDPSSVIGVNNPKI